MWANGISSMESTSIRPDPGPTGYRPPSLTLGRFHSRNDTVISPASTLSRSSLLKITLPRLRRPRQDQSPVVRHRVIQGEEEPASEQQPDYHHHLGDGEPRRRVRGHDLDPGP